MPTDPTAGRVAEIREQITAWRAGTRERDAPWQWTEMGLLCDALTAAESARDQARTSLEEHRIAYTALTGERDGLLAERHRLQCLLEVATCQESTMLDPAVRARLEAAIPGAPFDANWTVTVVRLADVKAILAGLAAAEASATRLAALEPIIEALAHWPLGCPEFIVALWDLKANLAAPPGEGRR